MVFQQGTDIHMKNIFRLALPLVLSLLYFLAVFPGVCGAAMYPSDHHENHPERHSPTHHEKPTERQEADEEFRSTTGHCDSTPVMALNSRSSNVPHQEMLIPAAFLPTAFLQSPKKFRDVHQVPSVKGKSPPLYLSNLALLH